MKMDEIYEANEWLLNGPSMTPNTDVPEVDEVVTVAAVDIEEVDVIIRDVVDPVQRAGAHRQSPDEVEIDDDVVRVEVDHHRMNPRNLRDLLEMIVHVRDPVPDRIANEEIDLKNNNGLDEKTKMATLKKNLLWTWYIFFLTVGFVYAFF